MFESFAEWQIVGEASNGVEGVRKTEELQPDIILLDVGLPKLNGIDAAKPILSVAPTAKLFSSVSNSVPSSSRGPYARAHTATS